MTANNARNQVQECLQKLGWPVDALTVESLTSAPPHRARASLRVPEIDLLLTSEGEAWDTRTAGVNACEDLLVNLREQRADLFFNEDELRADAQAGDALIKLAIYGWEEPLSPAQRTEVLQRVEADRSLAPRLAEIAGGHSWAQKFGPGIGGKQRATIVEAALWRHFQDAFRCGDVRHVLADVRRVLGVEDPRGR